MSKPRVTIKPGADHYSAPNEKIIEVFDAKLQVGCLISIRRLENGTLVINPYAMDDSVYVVAAEDKIYRPPASGKYIAYITSYRGSGRPKRTCVRPGNNLKDADPMAARDGAVIVGVYDTPGAAAEAAELYWKENVVVDEDGYSQWK